MSSDNQFTAVGPAVIGFQTHGANIQTGANISGNDFGVFGSCGAGLGENGAGVQGVTEVNNGTGVVGMADTGTNAFGVWGVSRDGFAGHFTGRVRVTRDLEVQRDVRVFRHQVVQGNLGVLGNHQVIGKLTVNGELNVLGTKSAVVRDEDGALRRLYTVESPESWFEDFGFGQLVDSHAQIELDGVFAYVVENAPYHVFISEYDGSNGLYVTERTSSGFVVRASESGVNCDFSYRVAAKRKDVGAARFEEMEEPADEVEERAEEGEKRRPGEPAPPQDPH